MSTTASHDAEKGEATVEFSILESDNDNERAKFVGHATWKEILSAMGFMFIVLITLIAIILLTSSQKNQHQPVQAKSCALLSERPTLVGPSSLITSSDHKSIASFKGYLEFSPRDVFDSKQREGYQVLKLRTVDWLQTYRKANETNGNTTTTTTTTTSPPYAYINYRPDDDEDEFRGLTTIRQLRLTTDCAMIELILYEDNVERKWKVESATLVYGANLDNNNGEHVFGYCRINTKDQLNFPWYHYYRCNQRQSLDCKPTGRYTSKDPIYIKLWIEELEFELNGYADYIKDGQFSKFGSVCTVPAAAGKF